MPYYYGVDVNNDPLINLIENFVVDPSQCEEYIEYQCEPENFCTDYDSSLNLFLFSTTDEVEFPPGTYSITITGSLGSLSD